MDFFKLATEITKQHAQLIRATYPEDRQTHSFTTAERYDALRKAAPHPPWPHQVFATIGVSTLADEHPDPDYAWQTIWDSVREFNTFTEDNDPHGEHDFGAFECLGVKMFWKIDDHGGMDGFELVLTVMLAEEY